MRNVLLKLGVRRGERRGLGEGSRSPHPGMASNFDARAPAHRAGMAEVGVEEEITRFLKLYKCRNGILHIGDIIPDFQEGQDDLSDIQMNSFRIFEVVMLHLHWVTAALDQCEDKINDYLQSRKRKVRSEGTDESSHKLSGAACCRCMTSVHI